MLKGEAKTDSIGRFVFKIPDADGMWRMNIKATREGKPRNFYMSLSRQPDIPARLLSTAEQQRRPLAMPALDIPVDVNFEKMLPMEMRDHLLSEVTVEGRNLLEYWQNEAIGARTAEAQTHREIASGLSTPVGFKNGTDGSLDACVNGIASALGQHHFLGVTEDGLPAVFSTAGNAYAHVVLRGGHEPNFDAAHVAECERRLKAARLPANIVVDCSHANSHKRPEEQAGVLRAVVAQIEAGNASIRGAMLESFLEWGAQKIPKDLRQLRPGLSVTDACIDWPTTETLLREMRERLSPVVASRRR